MDKIKKLLRKISCKNREKLLIVIDRLESGDKSLKVEKIKNSDFFRVRSGDFRIIFHFDGKEAVIDSIRLRDDKTYKNL